MKLFTKYLSSVLMLWLCMSLQMQALSWHMPQAWAAAAKVFASHIIKPISQIHRPLILAKINSTKVGIVASVGAAIVAACWFSWKKIVARRVAADAEQKVVAATEMKLRQELEQSHVQIATLQEQLQQAQYSLDGFEMAKKEFQLVRDDLLKKQEELNALRTEHEKLIWANATLVNGDKKKIEELNALCVACEKLQRDYAQLQDEFKQLKERVRINHQMVEQEVQADYGEDRISVSSALSDVLDQLSRSGSSSSYSSRVVTPVAEENASCCDQRDATPLPVTIYDQEKTLYEVYDDLDKELTKSEKKLSKEMKEDSFAGELPDGPILRTRSAKLQAGSRFFWKDHQEGRQRSESALSYFSKTLSSPSHDA